jgi:hypothetical protein
VLDWDIISHAAYVRHNPTVLRSGGHYLLDRGPYKPKSYRIICGSADSINSVHYAEYAHRLYELTSSRDSTVTWPVVGGGGDAGVVETLRMWADPAERLGFFSAGGACTTLPL